MTNEGARRSQKPSRLNISATFCFLRHEKDLSPYSVADPPLRRNKSMKNLRYFLV